MPCRWTDKNAARDVTGYPHDAHCLALLPGNRGGSEMLSADFLKTAQLLRQRYRSGSGSAALNLNAKRREAVEKIKRVAPDLAATNLLDGMARGRRQRRGSAGLQAAALGVCFGKMPDGSGISYEALPLSGWRNVW